jgi:glycosyltransferase involved in cell wall biosynthesis
MIMKSVSRADLHIHSRYSDRPSEWFLRRIGAPESFMEPREVYKRCREAGMDFVTISDHNCIKGALEIADLPGTFISSELTTYFPENGCKLHVLVTGITGKQFEYMQELRENIYDLREYIIQNDVIASVAHPLFTVNERMTVDLFEKMLLMFNRFEGINGSRNPRACATFRVITAALTPDAMEKLADKHGIIPIGDTPWVKTFTGGSDDHGGLYGASAWTETPHAATVFDYLDHIREGEHSMGGQDGSSLMLANSLIHIAYAYVSKNLSGLANAGLLGEMLKNLSVQAPEKPENNDSAIRAATKRILTPIIRRQKMRQLNETERLLIDEFQRIAQEHNQVGIDVNAREDRYAMMAKLAHQLSFTFMNRSLRKLKEGSLIGSIQSIASLSPVLLGVAPFLTAFSTQHKDAGFLRILSESYPEGKTALKGKGGRAWITDTFNDVNGVAKTIHKLASLAGETESPITVITSMPESGEHSFPTKNFTPVGTFSVPEYPELNLSLPPVLDIVRYIEKEDFDELLISTPGPMGLTALLAARLLGLPAKGIYHTDFPHYVEKWTDDESMGEITRQFMRWFYGKVDLIYAPTNAYVEEIRTLGFPDKPIDVLPRGVDLDEYSTSFKDDTFWTQYGLQQDSFKFVYVGRVSSEKNIDILLEAFSLLQEEGLPVELAVVGDGPDLKRLKEAYANRAGLVFTGYLHGETLSTAYASADALAFPSMSDTFGNVVLEAHACGIPAVVSDKGGPQEIVRSYDSGIVVSATKPEDYANGMRRLATDSAAYTSMQNASLECAQNSRWNLVLEKL